MNICCLTHVYQFLSRSTFFTKVAVTTDTHTYDFEHSYGSQNGSGLGLKSYYVNYGNFFYPIGEILLKEGCFNIIFCLVVGSKNAKFKIHFRVGTEIKDLFNASESPGTLTVPGDDSLSGILVNIERRFS